MRSVLRHNDGGLLATTVPPPALRMKWSNVTTSGDVAGFEVCEGPQSFGILPDDEATYSAAHVGRERDRYVCGEMPRITKEEGL